MRRLLAVLVGVVVATGAMAGAEPINLSLTPDIAIYDRNTKIEG